MKSPITTIGIVDDHMVFTNALNLQINTFENCRVTLIANHGRDLQEQLTKCLPPQIILLDVNMPVMDGSATFKWLRINYPDVKIIILSGNGSEACMIKFLSLGANAFLSKTSAELKRTINEVIENGFSFSGQQTKRAMLSATAKGVGGNKNQFLVYTEEEELFLNYAATDMTYDQIAATMKTSSCRVEKLRGRLCDRVDVTSRVGLAVAAIKSGLVAV